MAKIIKSITPLRFPWQTLDPFIFCVFHKDDYPKGNGNMEPDANLSGRNIGNDFEGKDGWSMYHGSKIPGFPSHPHRGFETITIVEEGMIDHSDSLGAAARFGHGDVQWMTAGKGVQHSEMFPMLNVDKGNPTDFFQIWLNLPKAKKLVPPYFGMLWAKSIPEISNSDEHGNKTRVRIIAGKYKGIQAADPTPNSWANNPENEVMILTIWMDPNTEIELPAASGNVNRALYFFKGDQIQIDSQSIGINNRIELNGNENIVVKNGDVKSRLLFLQGKPIGEPIAQYGPFVMNSQQELMEAFEDYRKTEFGGWPWPSPDHVHGAEKGKFALYPDGKEIAPR